MTTYSEYVRFSKGLDVYRCNKIIVLDTIYYLLPYLSVDIDERVTDKYCKRELLQDPQKEESISYCDRNYKILADYQ